MKLAVSIHLEACAKTFPDGTHALLALDKVQAGDLTQVTAEQRETLRQQMAQAYAVEATREMVSELRGKVKVKYNKTLM